MTAPLKPLKSLLKMYGIILSLPPAGTTLLLVFAGLAVGWWLYVPLHELLHAAGCIVAGGRVHRLEIASTYGGDLLAGLFDFVSPGGEYAGRLSGFETGGSDMVYAVTIAFPYLLSIGGFILLKTTTLNPSPFRFGCFLPLTLAPLISLTGDFFELGSLALFQIWPGPENTHRLMISDDLFRLLNGMTSGALEISPTACHVVFITLSLAAGLVFAWSTLMISYLLQTLKKG